MTEPGPIAWPAKGPTPVRLGFRVGLAAAGLLAVVYGLQGLGPWWHPLAVAPGSVPNLATGWAHALLHGSIGHLAANAVALVGLWTLARALYPRAAVRAVLLAWVVSFLAIWGLGDPASRHLGASGITYGLMALVTTLGLIRRDRAAIGASLIVWFLFGGAWWAMIPGYPAVSWEGHLGGALGGALAAVWWRGLDPPAPPVVDWGDDSGEGA